MKKRILILFPEGNLPYSPTTLNLIGSLAEHFEVTVIANIWANNEDIEKPFFNLKRLNEDKELAESIFIRVLRKLSSKLIAEDSFERLASIKERRNFEKIKKCINDVGPDIIIAVDLFALFCCQKLNLRCTFLSFEIPSESVYYKLINYNNIDLLITQSVERYEYLFKGLVNKPQFFLLPNAPIFEMPERRTQASKKFVYNGNIWSAFGVQFCLTFITKFPQYVLGVRGSANPENLIGVYFPYLAHSDNLLIENRYLSWDMLKDYLLNFSIGFCFYNFEHPFIKKNSFNYETGPAGKLYSYLSVGMPVICSDLKAFKIIEDRGAGILIKDYSPDTIMWAVETISKDYKHYSDNALRLGEEACFKKNSLPIIEFLLQT